MRVLIIGNTSVVGHYIRARLSPAHNVTMAGRDIDGDMKVDLSDLTTPFNPSESFDILIHCAASFGGDEYQDMIRNEQVNAIGSFVVGHIAESTGCSHVIYISTISACVNPDNGCLGSYGLSKLHGQENLDLFCRKKRILYTALQPSQLYDKAALSKKHQPLLYHFLEQASAGKDITIHGSADPMRNYLYIEDFVDIVERVLEEKVTGIFPCVHPRSTRLSEVAAAAFNVYDQGGNVCFDASKVDPPLIYFPSDYRLYRTISYHPDTNLVDGLRYIRNYQQGWQ